jgi:uncharacterized protein
MSLPPEGDSAHSVPSASAGHAPANEFSHKERSDLLRLAHEAIEAALARQQFPLVSPSPRLAEPRGAFTSLYCHGRLRGCMGYVFPTTPLFQTVVETARAAALEDTRFSPVRPAEAPHLEISLSILSRLTSIQPELVEVGLHGLLVSLGGHRGVLLPQVPVEHEWDRITFLEQTCKKAGLPMDAWNRGATLEVFTAEVFGDSDIGRVAPR